MEFPPWRSMMTGQEDGNMAYSSNSSQSTFGTRYIYISFVSNDQPHALPSPPPPSSCRPSSPLRRHHLCASPFLAIAHHQPSPAKPTVTSSLATVAPELTILRHLPPSDLHGASTDLGNLVGTRQAFSLLSQTRFGHELMGGDETTLNRF
jgi:hypothetical protein